MRVVYCSCSLFHFYRCCPTEAVRVRYLVRDDGRIYPPRYYLPGVVFCLENVVSSEAGVTLTCRPGDDYCRYSHLRDAFVLTW